MRQMNADRSWTSAKAPATLTVPGRAVLLCRNVGLHMYGIIYIRLYMYMYTYIYTHRYIYIYIL